MNEESINSLREALSFSPENIPLRLHLADSLTSLQKLNEAEKEYKHVLGLSPDNIKGKTGLANVYYALGNYSTAMVIM
jgi:transitional endoplasmic reticulum ATPase